MNEYLLEIYEERKARAEECMAHLEALCAEINRKRSAFVDKGTLYLSADRAADYAALNQATEKVTRAFKDIIDLEDEAMAGYR